MEKTIYTKLEDKKQIHVKREFDAEVPLVWRTWTESDLLDQWWAPKPWKTETKQMDFKEGGYWLYSMNGPEGEKHWARMDYSHIKPTTNFTAVDAFCDESGNKNPDIPSNDWSVSFKGNNGTTTVEVLITYPSIEAMEEMIKMGFKEGFAMGHDNLDSLLETMKTK